MYGKAFCKVYNEFGWNYFPEAFGSQLLLWMEETDFHPRSCLDIGCGTGVLCGILQQQGIRCTGVDLSESMIEIAKKGFPEVAFRVADMVTYVSEEPVELVTCTGDALNHITDLGQVEETLRNVAKSLTPGGYFIADILNEKEVGNGESFDFDYDETTSAKFSITAGENREVCLRIRVFERGSFAFEETITEKIHDPEVICSLLRKVGFSQVSLTHQLLAEQKSRAVTWFVIARR